MKTITVFKGDGIGPEITDAVLAILDAAKAPLTYEIFNVALPNMKRTAPSFPMLPLPPLKRPASS